jgi:hypothetical protein
MASLVITVDAAVDVVMSATPAATSLGVTAYAEPAILTSTRYAPDSPYLNGSTALSFRREQTLLNFTVAPFLAANEVAADALVEALRTSVERMGFNVTVARNGVTKVWYCDAGSVTPAGPRSLIDLNRPYIQEWNVSIPCSPVVS